MLVKSHQSLCKNEFVCMILKSISKENRTSNTKKVKVKLIHGMVKVISDNECLTFTGVESCVIVKTNASLLGDMGLRK